MAAAREEPEKTVGNKYLFFNKFITERTWVVIYKKPRVENRAKPRPNPINV